MDIKDISLLWKKQKALRNANSTALCQVNKTTCLTNDSLVKNFNQELKEFIYRQSMPEAVNRLNMKSGTPQDVVDHPFGKVDKDGKTAFGRLYQESKKRHYLLHDSRDLFFDKNDITNLINKTYDAEFRINTHRRTHWYNRTFDPKYIFTQHVRLKNISKIKLAHKEFNKLMNSKLNSSELNQNYETQKTQNETKYFDPNIKNYLKLLRGNPVITIRPKHVSFRDTKNNTVCINKENDTFILHRSNKIPWDNITDLEEYKAYRIARRKFYNKTLDIVFSYYIFHRFDCINSSRDVGYGRMSNVINHWYNRTFVAKHRPDMFYLHNRYKPEKEMNYYKNDLNIIHAIMSDGEFDPIRWSQFIPELNRTDRKKNRVEKEFNRIDKESSEYEKRIEYALYSHEEARQKSKTITIPKAAKEMLTTLSWKQEIRSKSMSSSFTSTTPAPTNLQKISFFQAIKEKSFDFFKSLFTKKTNKRKK